MNDEQILDLYSDDLPDINNDSNQVETFDNGESNYEKDNNQKDNSLYAFLNQYNINPDSINMTDDEGNIQSVKWSELDERSRLNILNDITDSKNNSYNLNRDELELINEIRKTKLSPYNYIRTAIQNNLPKEEPKYTVDDISDDELFTYYLLDTYGEDSFTEQELIDKLEMEKSNPELYDKHVSKIREKYKDLENQKRQREIDEVNETHKRQYAEFSSYVADSINRLNNLGDLELQLDNNEKNNIYDFILNDESGNTMISQYLQNPENLVKVAWYALYGEGFYNDVVNYFKKEIQRNNKSGVQNKPTPKSNVVINKKKSNGMLDLYD